MSLERHCDVCGSSALFQVGWWDEGNADRLMDTSDVCGAMCAKQVLREWIKLIADAEKAKEA